MKLFTALIAALTLTCSLNAAGKETDKVPAALDFEMKSLEGKTINLSDYHGKVVLIVNVASECGATPQYAGLQELYDKYKDQGLVILGFPAISSAPRSPAPRKKSAPSAGRITASPSRCSPKSMSTATRRLRCTSI